MDGEQSASSSFDEQLMSEEYPGDPTGEDYPGNPTSEEFPGDSTGEECSGDPTPLSDDEPCTLNSSVASSSTNHESISTVVAVKKYNMVESPNAQKGMLEQ